MARLRVVAWLVVGYAVAACNGSSPAGPDQAVPIYGSCNQRPNYIDEVALNRWRSFPLPYFFDSASFSPDFVDLYRDAIGTGIQRWADVTGTALGTIVEVDVREDADLVVIFRDVLPADISARAFHRTGTPFLAGGEIAFNRLDMEAREQRVRDGLLDREIFIFVVTLIAAHEMGHILGIIGHPMRDDVLMGDGLVAFPQPADLNTLIHAYCRP